MKLFGQRKAPEKGVQKTNGTQKFGISYYFSLISDKIWNIVTVNMLFFATNLPIFALFAYFASVGGIKFFAPSNVLNQVLHGVMLNDSSPALAALNGVVGIQVESFYPGTLTKIFLFIGLLTLLTFGISNGAMTYIFKKYITGEHADTASDFFGSIKRNWKQTLVLGLIDIAIVFVILYDIVSYRYSANSFGMLVFFYLTLFISVLYLLMRPFIYLISVTFDIKTSKIIKNASILATAGWKRTLIGLIASALVYILNYVIYCYIPSLGALLLFIITVSFAWLIQIYQSYPVVKKFMIDPFYEEKKPDVSSEDAVFTDRG